MNLLLHPATVEEILSVFSHLIRFRHYLQHLAIIFKATQRSVCAHKNSKVHISIRPWGRNYSYESAQYVQVRGRLSWDLMPIMVRSYARHPILVAALLPAGMRTSSMVLRVNWSSS